MFEDKIWYKNLPLNTLDVCEENLVEFFCNMYERQEIWYKRNILKLPAPWTDNPILRDYKFTNVYRELDNSSQYLIQNVYLQEKDIKQVIFSIFVHRIFNKAETFGYLKKAADPYYTASGYPKYKNFDVDILLSNLQCLEGTGVKTLNQEAYKINTYIWGGVPRWKAYTQNIIQKLWLDLDELTELITTGTAEQVIKRLRKYDGIGAFLSHEYYQDFCDLNTYFAPGTVKFDKNSFTSVGPGCSVGIRLIFPSLSEKDQIDGITWLRDLSLEYLEREGLIRDSNFKYLHWDAKNRKYFVNDEWNISLHCIEMFACEYTKIWKMKIGQGKQRGKFIQH